jgi:hypothetical protein
MLMGLELELSLAISNPSGHNASRLFGLNNGCKYFISEEIQTIIHSSTFTPKLQYGADYREPSHTALLIYSVITL